MANAAEDAVTDLSQSFLRALSVEEQSNDYVTPRCISVLLEREEDQAKEQIISLAVARSLKKSDAFLKALLKETEDLEAIFEKGRVIDEVAKTKAGEDIRDRHQRLALVMEKMETYSALINKYEEELQATIRALKVKKRMTVDRKVELGRRWLELESDEESAKLTTLLKAEIPEIKAYIDEIDYDEED